MKSRIVTAACCLLAGAVVSSAAAGPKEDAKAIEAKAHGGYLAAVNSNNVDTVMSDLSNGSWKESRVI